MNYRRVVTGNKRNQADTLTPKGAEVARETFTVPAQMDASPPGSMIAPKALTIIHYAERGKPYAFHVMAPKEHLPFGKRNGNEMKFAVTWYRPRKGKKWRRG